MPALEVELRALEVSRITEETADNLDVTFNVNASISESDRTDGVLNMKYSIDLETSPAVARMHVAGTANVKGREDEVEKLLSAKERDGTPVLFMKIYQRVYPTLYLLCGSLKVPYPAPGLLRLNSIATEEAMRQVESKISL